jgi:competence protein ComEC
LKKQPLLILVIFFILGIFFKDQFSLDQNYILAIAGITLLVVITTIFKKYFLYRMQPYLLCVMFFCIGIVLHFFNTYENPVSIEGDHSIIFKISGKLNANEKYRKYEAVVQLERQAFTAVVYIPKSEKQLNINHYYQTEAFVSKPRAPQYDFQFDYSKYLQRKNIDFQCFINDEMYAAERTDLSWGEQFSQTRLDVLQNIGKMQMSSQSKEFLKGIILADRTEIDAQTVQDFSRSGLVHFLAISGTHIIVIFGLFYFLLIKVLPVKLRKCAILASLGLIWIFTAFIGFGSSVVRSSLMLTIYFIYILLQRKPDLLHSLALSAFTILLFDTQQIFDVGFQLSFLAVLGIFWLNQPILNHLPKQDNRLKKIIFNTISVSVSAQLATIPLVLYYFHQFSFISIIANFFIIPFSEIIIVFSFLMTALIALNADFQYLNILYEFIIEILLAIIHWFANFNEVFFENIPMNNCEVFFLFLIIFLLRSLLLKCNLKNFTRCIMATVAFFVVRLSSDFYAMKKSEVLIHDFSKNKVISIKKNNDVYFWIEEKSDISKIVKFVINPYCASRRVKRFEIKILPKTAEKIVYQHKTYEIK